jgi:hypothetical protein
MKKKWARWWQGSALVSGSIAFAMLILGEYEASRSLLHVCFICLVGLRVDSDK